MTSEPIRRVPSHATHRSLAPGAPLQSATAVDNSAAFRAPSQRMLVEWSLLLSPGRGKGRRP
jgi:hypothetical protein